MKFSLICVLALFSVNGFAKDVKDFNKVLMEDVQKDINTDNDQALKARGSRMRGPASVEEYAAPVEQEDNKFEKRNVRQTGSQKW
jgi:hypothetical protein